MEKKHITFLVPCEDLQACSRYRVYQFLPYLKDEYSIRVIPFMTNNDYAYFKQAGKIKFVFKLPLMYLKRIKEINSIPNNELVFVHRDITPFGPMFLEKKLHNRGNKIIFDLDDAVFVEETEEISKGNGLIYKLKYGKRFDTTIKLADYILCGNNFLKEHCNIYNQNVYILPTLIDTNLIVPKQTYSTNIDSLKIVWIGNPGNTSYIYSVLDALNYVLIKKKINNCELILIGASHEIETCNSKYCFKIIVKDWKIETEYSEIKECDFGIMPLFDTDWSRGKCALKALQYFAAGIPVLASNVGMNKEVVQNGENGYLVNNDNWETGFEKIIDDFYNYNKMGKNARKLVEEKYSINSRIDFLKEILDKAGE